MSSRIQTAEYERVKLANQSPHQKYARRGIAATCNIPA
jgi:hypothetical protein